jgi:hypothetical protein
VEVHEGDLLAVSCKFSHDAHRVNNHLKQLPVVVTNGWVGILDPNAKAFVVDEAMEESDVPDDRDDMFFLKDCNKKVCNGGCW